MKEREPVFSEDEKTQIGLAAREFARIGEDIIWDGVYARLEILKLALQWGNSPELKTLFPTREAIYHEADVVGEIVRQARVIMQLEGRDSLSILDREAEAAGMGSVFDPESKIGKVMKGLF